VDEHVGLIVGIAPDQVGGDGVERHDPAVRVDRRWREPATDVVSLVAVAPDADQLGDSQGGIGRLK
jgi:hypothetical protein